MERFSFYVGRFFIVVLGLFLVGLMFSCRDEYRHFDKGEVWLRFSQDTVRFDTILSTQTSRTQVVTVRNPSSKAVTISRVYLKEGSGSRFRFNLDGDTALEQRNVVISGKDSLYVFIQTVLDFRNEDNPFEVTDYLCFELNGMPPQKIVLSAWGQDAHYWTSNLQARVPYKDPLQGSFYEEDSLSFRYFLWNPTEYPFSDRKAYVVYGYLTVPSGLTLDIPAGTRLYFAANSGIWLQAGSRLNIEGTLEEPVLMTSLRQDGNYRNMAGQWGRICMDSLSGPHTVEYAVIRNGQSGIWMESGQGTELEIGNTRIENMSRHGIMAKNARIEGVNLCVSETQVNLCLVEGGRYNFTHCTFVNEFYGGMIGVYNRCLYLDDKKGNGENHTVVPMLGANFNNSILYGRNSRQLEVDMDTSNHRALLFTRCLIRQEPVPSGRYFDSCRWNENPYFRNADAYDFDIDTVASAAVGLGEASFAVGKAAVDIKGRLRSSVPASGAYEFYPKEENAVFRFRWKRP